MATIPPPARKRPWYLVIALIGAWVFGASGMTDGCSTIAFFKSDRIDASSVVSSISDDQNRAAAEGITEEYFASVEAAKTRVYPLGIAALLLGAVMWAFAAGAMAGRPGARKALLQVLCAQTALVAVSYLLTADVRAAALAAEAKLHALDAPPKDPLGLAHAFGFLREGLRSPGTIVGLRVLANGLIILALTRARTRAFFEPAARPVSE